MLPEAKRTVTPARLQEPKPFVPFFGGYGEKCGHLFAAVITQAFHDAFAAQALNVGEKTIVRRDSIAFLTAKSGEWRAHRTFLCTCIGIDGDALAQSVRDMLTGKTSPHIKDRRLSGALHVLAFNPEQIEAARAMYREMNDRTPAPRRVRKPKPVAATIPNTKPALVATVDDSDVLKDWYANMATA